MSSDTTNKIGNESPIPWDSRESNVTSLSLHNVPICGREKEIEILNSLYDKAACAATAAAAAAAAAPLPGNQVKINGSSSKNSNDNVELQSDYLIYKNCSSDDDRDGEHDEHSPCHVDETASFSGSSISNTDQSTIFIAIKGEAGSGKSRLIHARAKEWSTSMKSSNNDMGCIFGSGKYEQIRSSEPMSALVDALNGLIVGFLSRNQNRDDHGNSDDDDDDNQVDQMKRQLAQTMEAEPVLCNILAQKTFELVGLAQGTAHEDKKSVINNNEQTQRIEHRSNHDNDDTEPSPTQTTSQNHTSGIDVMKLAIWRLLSCLCHLSSHPVILFLDDLQWSDHVSYEVLKSIALSNLQSLLLIVSYRDDKERVVDNSKPQQHSSSIQSPSTFVNSMQNSPCKVHIIRLHSLSIDEVNNVILSATKTIRDREYTKPLSQVVHKLTNGNPFFVLQFLMLLYEEGFLYYSTSRFQWVWADVAIIEKEMNISDNVIDIVLTSMRKLPTQTQNALMIASCFGTEVPLSVLREYHCFTRKCDHDETDGDDANCNCEGASKVTSNQEDLIKSLDIAVKAGILKHDSETQCLRWVHDKLQASAYSLLSDDSAKEQIHLRLGLQLWNMISSSNSNDDWIVYTAADQLDRVPASTVISHDASKHNDEGAISRLDLAELNLRAARLAISKCAAYAAAGFLRSAVSHLDEKTRWVQHYGLCLEAFNSLLEVEFEIGNREASMDAINEVLDNAISLEDKFRAQCKLLSYVTSGKDRDLDKGMQMAIDILSQYNVYIPNINTMTAKWNLYKERKLLQSSLPNLDSMVILPRMSDSRALRISALLCDHLGRCATDAGNTQLFRITSYRALRLAATHGVTHETCSGIIFLSIFYMKKGKFKESHDLAELAIRLISRFEEVPGGSHCKVLGAAYSSILPKMRPFHTLLDGLLDANRVALRIGDMEWVSLTAMFYSLCYLCIGSPLKSLQKDLTKFLNQARQFGRAPSICAVFQIFQQTIINLHDASVVSPSLLVGDAMDQYSILNDMEGKSRSMTLRDISTFRLLLSCIYGDWDTAKEMMDIVSSYPFHDMVSFRSHIRLSYVGLAALAIGRERKLRKYTKLGKSIIRRMTNEVKRGAGVNTHPILVMLLAEESPSKARFDEACRICARSGLTHHEAYICERAGLYFLHARNKDEDWAKYFLGRAVALYTDWGATGKVAQMKRQHGKVVSNFGTLRSSISRMHNRRSRTTERRTLSSQFMSADIGSNEAKII